MIDSPQTTQTSRMFPGKTWRHPMNTVPSRDDASAVRQHGHDSPVSTRTGGDQVAPRSIDRVIHDGEEVKLGGATLVAHLTPGHTKGCTTWTLKVQDGGKTYNVLLGCSLRAPAEIPPATAAEFERSFKVVRTLPCDVQLGDHGAQYNMQEKYAKLKSGSANSFVDPKSCFHEADVEEAMYRAILAEQNKK